MKNYKKILIVVVIIILLILIGFFVKQYLVEEEIISKKPNSKVLDKIRVDPLFLKISLREGIKGFKEVVVTNEGEASSFLIETSGLDGLFLLDNYDFYLEKGEKKIIKASFDTSELDPGIYLGKINILFKEERKEIPVILEVESDEVLFDSENIKLFPLGEDITPGKRINLEIKIYDLERTSRETIEVNYFIMNFDKKVIVAESENLVIEDSFDYSKTLNLPNDIKLGSYVIGAIMNYRDSVGTSTLYFEVVEKKSLNVLSNTFVILLVFIIIFLLFLWFLFFSLYHRDRLLKELQKQYKRELERQKEMVELKAKSNYHKLKNKVEKKEYKREIREVKKKRLKGLKDIYKERVKKVSKLKKSGKKSILKSQLEIWKRKGYDTQVLENKYKVPEASDIRKKIKQWKRKGYDTKVLERKLK
ncbi:MAG: hypothetical protein ABIH37_03225 [archaeon]